MTITNDQSFSSLKVYQLSEKLSDKIWFIVLGWNTFAKKTVGSQIVRSADSVGANLAEGTGRGSYQDNRRFVKIARGSLYETRHWVRRATMRELLNADQVSELNAIIDELSPRLNAYLNSIGTKK